MLDIPIGISHAARIEKHRSPLPLFGNYDHLLISKFPIRHPFLEQFPHPWNRFGSIERGERLADDFVPRITEGCASSNISIHNFAVGRDDVAKFRHCLKELPEPML